MLHLRMAKPIARMNQVGTREPFSGLRHRNGDASLTIERRKRALLANTLVRNSDLVRSSR